MRGFVVVGALVGITACQHSKKYNLDDDESLSSSESSDISMVEEVYGPPIDEIDDVSPLEVVYGPPSDFIDPESVSYIDEPPER